MAPPSRRRVLPTQTLAAFGAAPLYPPPKGILHGNDSSQTASLATARAPNGRPSSQSQPTPMMCATVLPTPPPFSRVPLTGKMPVSPDGLSIKGWKITTRNSTIGDEKGMEELTLLLEETANDTTETDDETTGDGNVRRNRRLCPPEITFLDAVISFQYQSEKSSSNLGDDGAGEELTTTEIRFTAQDALLEWAEAHRYLEMQQHPQQDHRDETTVTISSCREGVRGVSILRTVDAEVWSSKPRNTDDDAAAAAVAAAGNSEFYYDWTFSSPYAGTIRNPTLDESAGIEKKNVGINNRRQWKPLQRSHIPFHLLQDTSQPILLFDDIHLYEDDLHDNGDVSFNIKVRVMPRCWYVLQRLYVRVDHVTVRCREVRYFCLFDNNDGSIEHDKVRPNTIYRDMVWREAAWGELGRLALPTDPATWREEDGNVLRGVAGTGMPPSPPLASLLARLPTVALPDDLPKFACFNVFKE